MKKVLFPILAVVLALSLALPMAAVVGAASATMTVVSDDSGATVITTVYNKALGVQTTVTPTTPLTPVRAQEPDPYSGTYVSEYPGPYEATDSTWDNGVNWFEDDPSSAGAAWIWETERAEGPASYAPTDPLYDADAARYGRVVLFETTFNIPGNPISATLHIAADNGYEAWVNSGTHYLSPTVGGSGWETSNLWEANLSTTGWQSYGTLAISGSELVNGSNTLYVLAGNEYFWTDDGDSPVPPTQSNPYAQYNPGAAIFQLDVEYEEFVADPGINIEKSTRGGMTRAHEGDSIIYIYTVTNTGNVPLSSVAVTDPDVDRGPAYVSGDDGDGILQTTETWIYRAAYVVPYFFAGPVTNTGTASGWYETTEVTDTDDASVAVVHNPDIEVTKVGPEGGFFESVDAEYDYTVTNTGDSALHVTLVDDQIGIIATFDLTPEDAPWTGNAFNLLECDGTTLDKFVNVATAEATDAAGGMAYDQDCWTVIIFQWQPRTIGFWGNWERHYTESEFESLRSEALGNSRNLQALYDDDWYGENNVHDFLLGKPPNFKGDPVGKAQFLMEKQYLATWLNVKAYWDWTGEINLTFPGTADVGMDPNATVYLTGEAEVALFGSTPTVMDILDEIETHKADWTEPDNFKTAQIVLDKLNNAENNGYGKFVDRTHLACAFLYPVGGGTSDNVLSDEPSQGCVVIFDDPTGEVAIEIDGNAHGLIADHEYSVWVRDLTGYIGTSYDSAPSLGYYLLDYFTTDGDGMGFFELNIDSADLPDGTYNIQVAINDPSVEPPYTTIIATVKYTSVTVG